MSYEFLIYETDGHIGRITFNRPEKLNTFGFAEDRVKWAGQQLMTDFSAALDEAEQDDDVKVVIIKGNGRSFSAGFDISRVYHVYEDFDDEPGKRRPSQRIRLWLDRKWTELNNRILLFPKVTIAQVHGHCIGEGTVIAEQCDITVVADDAQISHAEQRLGFAGCGESLLTLFQMVGYKRAQGMLLLGEPMDGKEAERIGWAWKSVPIDQLDAAVETIAQKVALLPKDGIAIGKASNHLALDLLGVTRQWSHAYVTHTLCTNLRFEEGEFSFLKERRQAGAKAAFHQRDDRYADGRGELQQKE